MALDRLAESLGLGPPRRFKSSLAVSGRLEGRPLVLAWPQTYMNLSGEAVLDLLSFYKIDGRDLLVMHDEMDLPPGRLKMTFGGGTAGHKGLSSILAALRQDFGRLRIGIGRPPKEIFVHGQIDYVLGDFLEPEWPAVNASLAAAASAAKDWALNGLSQAQLKVNRRPKPPEEICDEP
jgi:PTH1 family peptidyl-tRNA hydrolase